MKLYIVIQNCGYVSYLNYRVFTDKTESLDYHAELKKEHMDIVEQLRYDSTPEEFINLNINENIVDINKKQIISYDDQEVYQQLTWEELEISQDNSDIIMNLKLNYMKFNSCAAILVNENA